MAKKSSSRKSSTSTSKSTSSSKKKVGTSPVAEMEQDGVIKQGSIASFMRKRTQLVGFDFGHFKHVQYAVEFLDNALDAIETFHWKNSDPTIAYQLDTEGVFDDWIGIEEEMLEATTREAHGLSEDLTSVFSSMGDGNGDVTTVSASTPMPDSKTQVEKPVKKTKVSRKTDVDLKTQSIIDGMMELISPYLNLVMSEPVVIIRLSEIEDESLVFIEEQKNTKLYMFEVFDTGTGLGKSDLEKFGMYLASSKSEKLRQTRGSQGFGSPSAFSDAQNTTGKPIQVISKNYKSGKALLSEFFTTGENKKSYTIEPRKVDVPFTHGTYISLSYTNIKYNRGYVDTYVKQTALMNSHVNIIYLDPYNETHVFKRLVNEFPEEPKFAKAHPSSVNIGDFQDKLRTTENSTIKQFLTNSFVRISDRTAQNILANTENELQDRSGFLALSDDDFITFGKKEDYVYVYRKEKRIYGRSTKKRDKWITYLLNIANDEAVEKYQSIYKKYRNCLDTIVKMDHERKDLEKKRDDAPTKKEAKQYKRELRKLEKKRDEQEEHKQEIKKDFLTFFKKNKDAFEEISDKKVIKILEEKYNLVTLDRTSPKELQEIQVNVLYKYFTLEKYMSPPTDTAIPVGSDVLESVLIEEFNLRISKFDQYFTDDEDKEEEYELTNDPVEFPKMQAELSKNAADELEEDSKLFSLIQLEPDEFVSQMVRIPILKFNDVTREIKTINDFMSVSKNAYKHHSLYNDDIIEENLDFASAVTRSPTSGKGLAFVVEAAIAYGKNIKVPSKASDAVFRFVNRTPKLRDNTDCAIWKTISIVNWKNYKLDTFDNGIPKGPVRVFVNVSGPFVHLMFKSQSKQALAEDDNLMKEIKLALEQVGRRLRTYLTKRAKHQERKKRASKFLQFAPYISRSLFNILDRADSNQDLAEPEEIEEKLIGSIGKKPTETKVNAVSLDVEPKTLTKRLAPPAKKSEKPKVSKKSEAEKPKETKEDSKSQVQKTLVSKTPPKEKKSTKSPPSPKKPPARKKSEPEKPAGPMKINEENILKRLPSDKPVKISYLIKALGIKDITDARFLDMKLKILMKNGRVERSKIEGKSYFRKIE